MIDILQIPAFLCRQTDLLVAAAKSGRAVNVKKGQVVSRRTAMNNIAAKLQSAGCKRLLLITERGTTSSKLSLPQISSSIAKLGLATMRQARPSRGVRRDPFRYNSRAVKARAREARPIDGASAGACAAVAVGVNGLFHRETHPRPDQSPSDGPNMIPLAQMEGLLRTLKIIHEAARSNS